MIRDISNYKIILFDFDDTLCIHSKHSGFSSDVEHGRKVIHEDISVVYPIEECKPNVHMHKFMDYAHNNGIKLGLLSATTSYQHMLRKAEWVYDNYGYELENYSVGNTREKADMVESIALAFKLDKSQILFIDDLYSNIESVSERGFDACSPMEVVNFVENVLK
jgi:FMN phosphatase YigB (HAD superfamily)